ncbi:hypothetical protein ABD76_26485 [Paenibacillus dendritiformis]|nr:hypothetical protein [Paenibacillus dendritiformis]
MRGGLQTSFSATDLPDAPSSYGTSRLHLLCGDTGGLFDFLMLLFYNNVMPCANSLLLTA